MHAHNDDLAVRCIALNRATVTVTRSLVGTTHFTGEQVTHHPHDTNWRMLSSQKVPRRVCEGQRTNSGVSRTFYLV